MSNRLFIEVSLYKRIYDEEPMVLILAHDDYGQSYKRMDIDEFLDDFGDDEDIQRDVLSWKEFDDYGDHSELYSAIEVEFFDEVCQQIKELNKC